MQRVPASIRLSSLQTPKFDNNVASFAFFQKFDRARSGKSVTFRSQPDRNVRALNRLLQNGPQLFKIPKLPRAPGDTIALPVLYCSQADTESVRQFGLSQSKVLAQLPGTSN